jgi:type IV secretion system protein VirB9
MLPTVGVLALTSALLLAPPETFIDSLERDASIASPPPVAAAPLLQESVEDAAVAPLPPRRDARKEALETYSATGAAPVLYESNEAVHPWGHSAPVLTCAPLYVCVVHLEAGEIVRNIAAGDPVRWQIATASSGEPPTPHLVVKPTDFDLTTNLFLTTDRRTYSIELRSPSAADSKKDGFRIDRSLSFYYPADFVRSLNTQRALSLKTEESQKAVTLAEFSSDLSQVNFDYTISPRSSRLPLRVFDDGVRTFIQLRGPGKPGEAPAVFASASKKGKLLAVNFRPSQDGSWYIVDGVFPLLRIVGRSGRSDIEVTVRNRRAEDRR